MEREKKRRIKEEKRRIQAGRRKGGCWKGECNEGGDNERQAWYTVYHLLIIRYPSNTPKKPFSADKAKLFSSAKSVIFTVRLTLSGFRKWEKSLDENRLPEFDSPPVLSSLSLNRSLTSLFLPSRRPKYDITLRNNK